MFTGIIEATGKIALLQKKQGDLAIRIQSADLDMEDVKLGDSIATNGVCLTVVDKHIDGFSADLSNETIGLTGFAHYALGQTVNLEKAMQPVSRLGGHLVSGHVDGIATLKKLDKDARSWRLLFEAPAKLAKYIARKGSVTLDGISLTVNSVEGRKFDVNIVPHTWHETNLENKSIGDTVHIEVDLIARYLERLLTASEPPITRELLLENGFV